MEMGYGGFPRKRKRQARVPITSLMDALTIILIFLLVNYSDETDDRKMSDLIKLPVVYSKKLENSAGDPNALKLVLAKNQVRLNDTVVEFESFEKERERILMDVAQALDEIVREGIEAGKPVTRLSVQADGSIPYNYLDSIVVGASAVGITNLEFLAMNKPK